MKKQYFYYIFLVLVFCSCQNIKQSVTKSGLLPDNFLTEIDGDPVRLFVLTNSSGLEACITNYGGRLVSLMVPDKNGTLKDVVLGHDSIGDYINIDGNFGAIIGRYGNRIAGGKFNLDNVDYQLPQNNFGHCLHGGPVGFHHKVWTPVLYNDSTLQLFLKSPDGEAGFPGNLSVKVTYTLTQDDALKISYHAETDKPTIVNLTNHSYFNLSGDPSKDILKELVEFNADYFTPIDSTFMTNGEFCPVKNTPFDFRQGKFVGKDINTNDIQLRNGRGYDHNMVLNTKGNLNELAASITDLESGIKMEVYTTEPGIQFYVGNFLDGKVLGKKRIAYPYRSAICMESQHFPNSPNLKQYPSVVLRPGETYSSLCVYKFLINEE